MRKLYCSVLLILCPIILYFAFFFTHDSYNYLGLMKEEDTSTLIGKMLNYKNHSFEGVIIGDSRMVPYEPESSVANLAYGGAVAEEMNSLFWWCCNSKETLPEKVYIVTGFYNMNTLMQQDRVSSTEKTIENPFTYAFSIENLQAMIRKLIPDDRQDDQKSEVTLEQKKKNFSLSKKNAVYYLQGYSYDETVIDELCRICDFCKKKGIEIAIIIPPMYSGFYDILEEYSLEDIVDEYKATLSRHTEIYDFEYRECELSDHYEDFSDYFHFHDATYEKFLQCIEEGNSPYCRIWKEGTIMKNIVQNG